MAHRPETDKAAIAQLWKRLDDTRVGMLRVMGSAQHPQPMTHFAREDQGVIWFITSSDTDLAQAVGAGGEAGFTYQSTKGDYQASLTGRLEISSDSQMLDELWSTPVSAWFTHGREDPKVRLLKFTPREAAVWASDANPVLVGLKMLHAAQDGERLPDVGTHRVVTLPQAA